MIVSDDYPYLKVRFKVREKTFNWRRALVDTGCSFALIVPLSYARIFGQADHLENVWVADDRVVSVPCYLGIIEIDGIKKEVLIGCLGNTDHLIGRGIIDDFEICFKQGEKIELGG